MAWRAYWTVFKNSFVGQLEYRSETVVRILTGLVSFISVFYLWNDVFAAKAVMAGYTKPQIITYYLLVAYIFASIFTSLDISAEIRDGQLSGYLLRPISYLWYNYWFSLARRAFRFVIGLPILIGLLWLLRDHVYWVGDIKAYLVLALAMYGAVNILFLSDAFRNILEFWVVNSDAWDMIFDHLVGFFSGTMIPLVFLPGWIQTLADYLPFKYTGTFLVDAFMGRLSWTEIGVGFMLQTLWTVAMALVLSLVWQRGLKRYEAYGN